MSQLLKNISYTSIGQFLNMIFAFILLPLAARYLGDEGFGKYSLASTLMFFVMLFSDLGLETLMTREFARKKKIAPKLISFAMGAKIGLLPFAITVMFLYLLFTSHDVETKQVILIFIGVGALGSFSQVMLSVFRGFEKMQYEASSNLFEKALLVVLSLFVFLNGFGVRTFATAFLIAAFIKMLLVVFLISQKFFKFKISFSLPKNVLLLRSSLFFGISVFLAMSYNRIDIIMLSSMKTMQEVAWYSAAYRLLNLTYIISSVLVTSFLPQLSQAVHEKQLLSSLFFKGVKLIALIAIPMVPFIYLLAREIVLVLFGSEYLGSIIAIRILVFAAFAQMFNSFFVGIFIATKKQNVITFLQIIALIINVGLNLILIPKYTYMGAAFTTIITEFFLLVAISYYTVKNLLIFSNKSVFFVLKVVGITCLSAAIILASSIVHMNMYLSTFTACIIYLFLIYKLGLYKVLTV